MPELWNLSYLEAEGFVVGEEVEFDDGGGIEYRVVAEAWLPDEEFLRETQS
jgi:hypothetical protein